MRLMKLKSPFWSLFAVMLMASLTGLCLEAQAYRLSSWREAGEASRSSSAAFPEIPTMKDSSGLREASAPPNHPDCRSNGNPQPPYAPKYCDPSGSSRGQKYDDSTEPYHSSRSNSRFFHRRRSSVSGRGSSRGNGSDGQPLRFPGLLPRQPWPKRPWKGRLGRSTWVRLSGAKDRDAHGNRIEPRQSGHDRFA